MDLNFYKSLEDALNRAIKEAGKKIGLSLNSKMNMVGNSSYYDRTGDIVYAFMNPPIVKIGPTGIVNYSVIDFKKIISSKGEINKFNHHMSLNGSNKYKGTALSNLVPIYLDSGFKLPNGNFFGKYKGYINDALDDMSVNDFITEKFIDNAQVTLVKRTISILGGGK